VPAIAAQAAARCSTWACYIKLGQAATTLSGGEAQRVKLALELSKRDTGRTLYILDEPTTGLHFADIDLLLKVLHQLRDAGNTIVVIEHNLDVIKTADWLIDMGPEGGAGGGTVVVAGTPEDIAANPASHTGQATCSGYLPNGRKTVGRRPMGCGGGLHRPRATRLTVGASNQQESPCPHPANRAWSPIALTSMIRRLAPTGRASSTRPRSNCARPSPPSATRPPTSRCTSRAAAVRPTRTA
jgi:hypothetical protein